MKKSTFLIGLLISCFSVISFAEPPALGTQAPDFSLPDQAGNTRTLGEYSGNWLLLYFYPKDDTPGCT
ncbi:MAG: redoxin domain-containing protein, partial [Immundisolibacteraceae bacterium]|nr:redoxin domain-containing protein [Immundisolibacteraceae bacterium]